MRSVARPRSIESVADLAKALAAAEKASAWVPLLSSQRPLAVKDSAMDNATRAVEMRSEQSREIENIQPLL